VPFIYTLRKF